MSRWLALAYLCACTFGAQAAVKDSAADGFTVENSEWVAADPQTAWSALVKDVGQWWPADHTWWGNAGTLSIDARAGGCFCEIDGPRQAQHMLISVVEPGKLMRMNGGLGPLQGMGLSGALEWRFTPENNGTRLTLYYRVGGYASEELGQFAVVVDRVQAQQLGGLAAFLRRQGEPSQQSLPK